MRGGSSSSTELPGGGRIAKALCQADAQESLLDFVRLTWHVIEPSRDFVEGWVIEAICDHLEAVSDGEINRLLINVPPGFTKSLLTDVFWPAWEWGPRDEPTLRYLCFSYSDALTKRDNGRFKNLITSDIYRRFWGDRFGPGEQFGRRKIENDRTGWKFASSVGGVGTGERGDRVNRQSDAAANDRLEAERRYATQADVDKLREHIDRKFDDQLIRFTDLLLNRPPVKHP